MGAVEGQEFITELQLEHRALVDILLKIEALGVDGADEGVGLLFQAKTALIEHLRKEDIKLYPKLKLSTNSTIKDTADKFASEMKSISLDVLDFFIKYENTSSVISSDSYMDDLSSIITHLKERIGKEEKFLYPKYLIETHQKQEEIII
jgi:iron-sulfur cluster repair protein YtfE (RIC family)